MHINQPPSGGSIFLTPDNQINYISPLWKFNELVYERMQNQKRKQPDYILVFREKGIITNMHNAKKAAHDFGNIPIVIVDKDKCAESELENLTKTIEDYRQNKDKNIFNQIIQKIKNNLSNSSFRDKINEWIDGKFDDIDADKINDIILYMTEYQYFGKTGGQREGKKIDKMLKETEGLIETYDRDDKVANETKIKQIAESINQLIKRKGDINDGR